MILYLALSHSPLSEFAKLGKSFEDYHVLTSYFPLSKRKDLERMSIFQSKDTFLDSGAFSAFAQNLDVDIQKYCDFIKATRGSWTYYAALDVIGNYEATMKNLAYMEDQGLTPLPTFHYGSPLEKLDELLTKYDYVCLGGLVSLSTDRKRMTSWLNKCFKIVGRHWPKKIHGFGVNSLWIWEKYPFWSVDATSWSSGQRYRRVYAPDMTTHGRRSRNEYGVKANLSHGWELCINNATALQNKAKEITRLWEARGVHWRGLEPKI